VITHTKKISDSNNRINAKLRAIFKVLYKYAMHYIKVKMLKRRGRGRVVRKSNTDE
jgi:hypothetical protein